MEAINEMVENEEPHNLIMDRIVKGEFLKPWIKVKSKKKKKLKPWIEMAWHSGIW